MRIYECNVLGCEKRAVFETKLPEGWGWIREKPCCPDHLRKEQVRVGQANGERVATEMTKREAIAAQVLAGLYSGYAFEAALGTEATQSLPREKRMAVVAVALSQLAAQSADALLTEMETQRPS